jgi:hypothetical protein
VASGVASVMGAYNKFRGDRCCESSYLLSTILRDEWHFRGFVISDFNWGIRRTAKAANAGCDVEMASTKFYGPYLVQAVRNGDVAETSIDASAERIVRTVLDFKSRKDPLPAYPKTLLACDDHVQLARECAEKSIVLLKNEGGVLPFSKSMAQIAVIGKLGNVANIGDHGSSRVNPPYVITLVQGLRQKFGKSMRIVFHDGVNLSTASALAKTSNAVVLIVGLGHGDEGEFLVPIGGFGGDRKRLSLKQRDIALVKTVGLSNTQCCVCLIGGSAIMVEEWLEAVPSIVMAFYPGMEGGTAIANVLFGDVNPSGKLPFSVPRSPAHLVHFDRDATQVICNVTYSVVDVFHFTHTSFAFLVVDFFPSIRLFLTHLLHLPCMSKRWSMLFYTVIRSWRPTATRPDLHLVKVNRSLLFHSLIPHFGWRATEGACVHRYMSRTQATFVVTRWFSFTLVLQSRPFCAQEKVSFRFVESACSPVKQH